MENELLRPYFNFHNSTHENVLSDGKQLAVGMAVTVCNSWNDDIQTRTRGGHTLHTEYPPRGMETDRGEGEYKSLTGS